MSVQNEKDLERRVIELESLIWGVFRALETYITLNDLSFEVADCEKMENN